MLVPSKNPITIQLNLNIAISRFWLKKSNHPKTKTFLLIEVLKVKEIIKPAL
jgi:hypothetical protein